MLGLAVASVGLTSSASIGDGVMGCDIETGLPVGLLAVESVGLALSAFTGDGVVGCDIETGLPVGLLDVGEAFNTFGFPVGLDVLGGVMLGFAIE